MHVRARPACPTKRASAAAHTPTYHSLYTSPVDEHTGICCEACCGQTDVIIHLDDLAHRPCFLQLCCGFLFYPCVGAELECTLGGEAFVFVGTTSPVFALNRSDCGRTTPLHFTRTWEGINLPSTTASFPRTPTARVPLRTASNAYSTWNLCWKFQGGGLHECTNGAYGAWIHAWEVREARG
jgi:hypothetical protein